jgi:hypothetical protein
MLPNSNGSAGAWAGCLTLTYGEIGKEALEAIEDSELDRVVEFDGVEGDQGLDDGALLSGWIQDEAVELVVVGEGGKRKEFVGWVDCMVRCVESRVYSWKC